jgi:mRNA interferase RelE/StbE
MAEGIKTFRFTNRFRKEYSGLPKEIQEAFDQKLTLLMNDMKHPSLRIKRIQGTRNRWEGSVTMKYRFIFEFDEGIAIFRAIGTHDILNQS